MRIAFNAVSAQMGGAVTYLRSVVPALNERIRSNGGGKIVLWARREAFGASEVDGVDRREPGSAADARGTWGIARRLWFDQWELPRSLRQEGADALFSSASFGTLRSPVRQVLLVRNALYFDPVLLRRIPSRSVRTKYAAQRVLSLRSIAAADVVLFPSRAMLDLAALYTGGAHTNWRVAPYGGRLDMFKPPGGDRRERRKGEPAVVLHVSLYSDQKNFGTLFPAMERLEARSRGAYRLRMTAGIGSVSGGPWYPNLDVERELMRRLEALGVVEDLGPQPYASLPQLYRNADVFVFSSYTESFGHPLVEAMASGLPIVAADVPINREMCANAAVYFRPFDPASCAEMIERVASDHDLAARLSSEGARRSLTYTWERHTDVLWGALRGDPGVNS
jgi:glycosyltransferase involved in cell wall biosynthesis